MRVCRNRAFGRHTDQKSLLPVQGTHLDSRDRQPFPLRVVGSHQDAFAHRRLARGRLSANSFQQTGTQTGRWRDFRGSQRQRGNGPPALAQLGHAEGTAGIDTLSEMRSLFRRKSSEGVESGLCFDLFDMYLVGHYELPSKGAGASTSLIFRIPMRILVLIVPNGAPIASATSTCVRPRKNASSIASRCSGASVPKATRTSFRSSAKMLSTSGSGVVLRVSKPSSMGSSRARREPMLRRRSIERLRVSTVSQPQTVPRFGSNV